MGLHPFRTICTLSLACSLLGAGPISTSAFADEAAPSSFGISGWSEVVQSVSDLESHVRFLEEVAGWKPFSSGPVDAATLSSWQLDSSVTADQVLMGNPGTARGFIRLVRFQGAEQLRIRSNSQTWETGGILDINVRVRDMDANFREFQQHDWQAHSDPVQYQFGPFEVKEWIAVGPDDLSFALIERIQPELEGWPNLRDISRAFNSTQVVSNMPAALSFYRDVLGFRRYMDWQGVSKEAGPSVLGLPLELTTTVEREVWILHPEGINEGSVELLHFHGLSGRNLGTRAVPPNLGMLMLRFPVERFDAFLNHLQLLGIETEGPVGTSDLQPWGKTRQVSLRAPDGAWLDFYESGSP